MKPFAIVFAILSAFVLSANAADTFKVDPVHTFVLFSVQHLGIANTYGRFNDISGTVVFDKDNPSKSSVELSVPVESLDTHNSIRERSLKSPDFFDAKQFPTITFKSTKIEGSGDTLKVFGDLSIHGVTKPLTVDFKKGGEGKGVFGERRRNALHDQAKRLRDELPARRDRRRGHYHSEPGRHQGSGGLRLPIRCHGRDSATVD